jgi:hypothetical protein
MSYLIQLLRIQLAVCLITLLSACGGGGGGSGSASGDSSSTVPETGILFDAALENVAYKTPTLSGITSATGEFDFAIGETVVFSIGNYDFPAVSGATQVSLLDLLNSNSVDNAVINLARLLQSIDTNPDAGVITLPENINTDISNLDFNKSLEAFESGSIVLELLAQHSTQTTPGQLISAQEAVDHLYDYAADLGITLPPLAIEQDNDSDGILNIEDPDDDNDSIADVNDVDDDNNGLIEIRSLADLDDIRNHLDGSMQYGSDNGCLEGTCTGFELTQHLDFDTNNDGVMDAEDTYYNYDGGNGNGWLPLGNGDDPFTAQFDGNNYEIRNLFINRPLTDDIGLFGYVVSAGLRNIGLSGELMSVAGRQKIGGLVGYLYESTVINSYATGAVTGDYEIGGLVGFSESSIITDSEASGNVTNAGFDSTGGLVGYVDDTTITNSKASGAVTGKNGIGGLVGEASNNTTITDSEASGTVTGQINTYGAGGLVGFASDTIITRSTALGSVTCDIYSFYVGGLVGLASGNTKIIDSNASGHVTSGENSTENSTSTSTGGLVGQASTSEITNSNASGNVTSGKNSTRTGGLVGEASASTITDSNASGDVTGSVYVGELVGLDDSSTITGSEGTGAVTVIEPSSE